MVDVIGYVRTLFTAYRYLIDPTVVDVCLIPIVESYLYVRSTVHKTVRNSELQFAEQSVL